MDSILKCLILAVIISVCSSCLCKLSHLQTRFCTSSFVLRVKVIRESLPSATKVNPIGEVLADYADIPLDAKWVYDVDVIEAYKVPKGSNIKKGDVMQATTDAMMSCGERLRDKGQEYLLSESRNMYQEEMTRRIFAIIDSYKPAVVKLVDTCSQMFLTSTGEKYPHNVICDFLGWNDGGKLNFYTCDFPTVFSDISPEQLAGLKGEYQCSCKITSQFLLNPRVKKSGCSLTYSCLDNYLKHGMCKESLDNGCVWDIAEEYTCQPEYMVQK